MSQPGFEPGGAGEHWNVNMPAVIAVVFAFLVGVVVWVIVSNDGEDDARDDASPAAVAGTTAAPAAGQGAGDPATDTTSPVPLPDLTAVSSSTAAPSSTSTTTTTVPPATTAPGAPAGAVPGDLAIPGRPMQQPGCDGAYITVLASAIGQQASATGIANVLDTYPGSNYLRTDQTCPSLTPAIDGEPIYVVYLGPFAFDSDACAARSQGPDGAYARRLSNDLGPDHSVSCA